MDSFLGFHYLFLIYVFSRSNDAIQTLTNNWKDVSLDINRLEHKILYILNPLLIQFLQVLENFRHKDVIVLGLRVVGFLQLVRIFVPGLVAELGLRHHVHPLLFDLSPGQVVVSVRLLEIFHRPLRLLERFLVVSSGAFQCRDLRVEVCDEAGSLVEVLRNKTDITSGETARDNRVYVVG